MSRSAVVAYTSIANELADGRTDISPTEAVLAAQLCMAEWIAPLLQNIQRGRDRKTDRLSSRAFCFAPLEKREMVTSRTGFCSFFLPDFGTLELVVVASLLFHASASSNYLADPELKRSQRRSKGNNTCKIEEPFKYHQPKPSLPFSFLTNHSTSHTW